MADTPERKKITLKPLAGRAGATDSGEPRQRSGSRAHRVARASIQDAAQRGETPAGSPRRRPEYRQDAPGARPEQTDSRPMGGRPPRRDRDDQAARSPRPSPENARRQAEHGQRGRFDNRNGHRESLPADTDAPGFVRQGKVGAFTRERNASRSAPQRQARPQPRLSETFSVFAPCPQGIEAALAQELTALGFTDVQTGRAGCRFSADWTGVMRANLHSRLATRILVQVAQRAVGTEDDLLALARDTPWERWFGPGHTLRVDTSAIRSPMQSLQYCNLRTKDGICDRLRETEGARPDIDTVRPDARVHLFLSEDTATLYLDSSGESLFKRGWRHDKGEAPLRENLAAGLLALSGWQGDTALMDPFCGSGTIMIEAAYIALGVPPGIARPFAFERLRHHDAAHWHALKNEARLHIRPRLEIPLIGSDINPRVIDNARHNADRAGLTPDAITFEVRDARELRPPEGAPGWIVSNPPYGERLDSATAQLWADVAQALKAHFGGWQAHIITSDRDLPAHMRLAAQRRTPLYNGALDCRLFAFEIVSGSYRQRI